MMNNRELTYYSLLSRAEMRHIEELADNTPQETFITLDFEEKYFHHLWIGANNEAFISTVSFITDLDKLSMTLQGQLKSYVRKNGYGFEEDKGDFYTTYLARKNWLKHTIFIFNNEYNKTKNEIFIEVVKWCKDWENEWLETFNPYSPKELKDMATDLKKPLWQSLENNEIEKKLKMNDSTDAKYIKCTSQEFITDISKLCDKCPLPLLITNGMKDQIIFQAQERKEILTTEQFNNYLDTEIESATKAMESVFLTESQNKEYKKDPHRANRIQHYIWNKERIKALNSFIEPLKKSNKTPSKKSTSTNSSLHDFIEWISGYKEIKTYYISVNAIDELKGTIPQLKEFALKINSDELDKFIFNLEEESKCFLSSIEVHNYFRELTHNFQLEEMRITLNDMIVFRDMELFEDLDVLAMEKYRNEGWDIPTCEYESRRTGKISIITDTKKMRSRVFPYLGMLFFDAIYLLESKIGELQNIELHSDHQKVEPVKIEKSLIKQKVESAFSFMLDKDPRQHKYILDENDYTNLINWVTFFFENEFKIPSIDTPIQKINTAKGNVFYTFKLLFKELRPSNRQPNDLFTLIKKCFYQYREDKITNMRKSKEPNHYKQMIKKNK